MNHIPYADPRTSAWSPSNWKKKYDGDTSNIQKLNGKDHRHTTIIEKSQKMADTNAKAAAAFQRAQKLPCQKPPKLQSKAPPQDKPLIVLTKTPNDANHARAITRSTILGLNQLVQVHVECSGHGVVQNVRGHKTNPAENGISHNRARRIESPAMTTV